MINSLKCANIGRFTLLLPFMSVVQTIRLPDDVHAAFKEYCDRIGNNPNAEGVIAIRKHIGMPTFEERLTSLEVQVNEVSNRLKTLEETNAIATQQSSDTDTQSNKDD